MGWFLNCKDFTEKVSQTMDERIPLGHRIMIRIRRWICPDSDAYYRQVHLMQKAAKDYDRYCSHEDSGAGLSEDACRRIKEMLCRDTGDAASTDTGQLG
jgi:hypothetical protein